MYKKLALTTCILVLMVDVMANDKIITHKPNDFINIKEFIPQIQIDMRYYSTHNFVGTIINGYDAPICLLTKPAAIALKKAEQELLTMNLTFKMYDCYRPQRAVNHFIKWATNLQDLNEQQEFYPQVNKANLFRDGYIAAKSGHSRGSTFDLTIVPLNSVIPHPKPTLHANCNADQNERYPDNSLDFGTSFDCFSLKSHPSYQQLSMQIKANRLLLQTVLQDVGFKGLDAEWWHWTLINEPYPDTYFDFPITK